MKTFLKNLLGVIAVIFLAIAGIMFGFDQIPTEPKTMVFKNIMWIAISLACLTGYYYFKIRKKQANV